MTINPTEEQRYASCYVALAATAERLRFDREVASSMRVEERRRVLHRTVFDEVVGLACAARSKAYTQAKADGVLVKVGMRERAATVRAQLTIRNNVGRGTELAFIVPAHLAYAQSAPRRRLFGASALEFED